MPIYYLVVFWCVGFAFMIDLFIAGYRFNIITSPSDFLRYIVSNKLDIHQNLEKFNEIYGKIKTYYVGEDMKKERELEEKRDRMALLMQ
jgi:hypothetical protein